MSPDDRPEASPAQQVAGLRAVLQVSRELAGTADLHSLLGHIERAAVAVLDCERATLFLHDRAADELYIYVATGLEGVRFPAGRGIAGQAFRGRAAINVPDAYADPRFNRAVDLQTGYRTRSILASPLLGRDNEPVGVLQVLNKRGGPFTAWDEELVGTLGAQAGVAVQRQLLLEESVRRQQMEQALRTAREIQRSLLPARPPAAPGFDVAVRNEPADETGGDFYDLVALPDGTLALTLADVTGHGIGPALLATACRALLRSALDRAAEGPDRVLARVNDLLCADELSGRFVTVFFGLLSPAESRLRYASAGQGPVLLTRGATGEVSELEVQGPPLGVYAEAEYGPAGAVAFEPGDVLLAATDGYMEWSDGQGYFGRQRLQELLSRERGRPAAEIIQCLHDAVLAFAAGSPQLDDLTAVAVKKMG